MRVAYLTVMVFCTAGCMGSRYTTRGIEEPSQMIEVISRQFPAGTPIDDAQRFMEREGFTCSRRSDESFGDRDGLDYIYCVRNEGGIVMRRWQVAVVHRDGRVVEVLASTGLIGP